MTDGARTIAAIASVSGLPCGRRRTAGRPRSPLCRSDRRDRADPLRALGPPQSSASRSTSMRCAADVYWIRAIQHYGGERLSTAADRNFELLFPLLDLATTLDPYFTIAYRFGAIFLSEPLPGGPGRPDQAIALLRKGHRRPAGEVAVPARHRLRVLLAPPRHDGLRDVVPAGGRAAGLAELAEAARGRCSRRRQRSRVRQVPVEPDSAVRRGMAEEGRRAQPQATRCARCDRPAAGDRQTVSAAAWGTVLVGGPGAARHPSRHSRRSGRHAIRDRPCHRSSLGLQPLDTLSAARTAVSPPPHDRRDPRARGAGDPRSRRWQLSQRLHPPSAAEGVDRPPALGLPARAATCSAGSTTSRSSAT